MNLVQYQHYRSMQNVYIYHICPAVIELFDTTILHCPILNWSCLHQIINNYRETHHQEPPSLKKRACLQLSQQQKSEISNISFVPPSARLCAVAPAYQPYVVSPSGFGVVK